MNRKVYFSPLLLSSELDPSDSTEVIGKGTGQGTEGLTFDEWMEDIVGSYASMEEALLDLDVNSDGVLDDVDYDAWMADNY